MSKLDTWIDNKIVQNLFAWTFLYIIFLTTIQTDDRALISLYAILLLAPAVYINNLFILPFSRKNKLIFFVLFIANTLLFSAVSVFIIHFSSEEIFQWERLVNFLGIMVLALAFASAIKMARDSFTRRQEEKEAELKLLKGQLNPHFLFNTLNNLYGLSVVKSDKLPDLMLKLSDLLRYSLYETKDAFVPLSKEVTYLENYMSLEKIRLEDKTDIQFTKSGDLSSIKIAPMLLIVFVENAFKHLGALIEEKSKVIVSVHGDANALVFKCTNTVDTINSEEGNIEKGRSGIGLRNAKKRLNLMYPEKYLLKTKTNDNEYSITLDLVVNNNSL